MIIRGGGCFTVSKQSHELQNLLKPLFVVWDYTHTYTHAYACTHTGWKVRAQSHMATYTNPHCSGAWGRGSKVRNTEVGEEIGGGGDSSNVRRRTAGQSMNTHSHTLTFTFATLPQFWYPVTPPPVRKESSHFTVYITYIDQ